MDVPAGLQRPQLQGELGRAMTGGRQGGFLLPVRTQGGGEWNRGN